MKIIDIFVNLQIVEALKSEGSKQVLGVLICKSALMTLIMKNKSIILLKSNTNEVTMSR